MADRTEMSLDPRRPGRVRAMVRIIGYVSKARDGLARVELSIQISHEKDRQSGRTTQGEARWTQK